MNKEPIFTYGDAELTTPLISIEINKSILRIGTVDLQIPEGSYDEICDVLGKVYRMCPKQKMTSRHLRSKISKIFVKNHLRTDQVAINEIVELIEEITNSKKVINISYSLDTLNK